MLIDVIKCPVHQSNECQIKQKAEPYNSPSTHQAETLETMEDSPSTDDTAEKNSSSSLKNSNRSKQEPESFSDIMERRFSQKVLGNLNKCDSADCKKIHLESGQPEYAQQNYNNIRQ